ncbi:amidophosphoribosyltransferase, partial [Candidatus Saccharibacteria bacterium]|nr:amidophosphoribosyltransferase [Candidatus Saccharibacteria bacterium]NIV72467.1 amidophosphoribosyltransferase [Calditrichia bacterium]NIW78747.1 amidophosphoribosyltransferase [Calditrichia bacterium]
MKPGEIIVVTPNNEYHIDYSDHPLLPKEEEKRYHHCIFELVYFARPDSYQFNEYVYDVRHKIGAK